MPRNKRFGKLKNLTAVAVDPNSDFSTALEACEKRWRLLPSVPAKKKLTPVLKQLLKIAPNDETRVRIATLIASMRVYVPSKLTKEELEAQAAATAAAKTPKEPPPPAQDDFWNKYDVPHTSDCLDEQCSGHGPAIPYWDGRTSLIDRLKSGPYAPSDYEPARARIATLIVETGIDPTGAATLANYRAIETWLWREREKLYRLPSDAPAMTALCPLFGSYRAVDDPKFKAFTNDIAHLSVAWMSFRKPPPKFEYKPAESRFKEVED